MDNSTQFPGFTFDTRTGLFEDFDKKQIINLVSRKLTSFSLSQQSDEKDQIFLVLNYEDGEYTRHYIPTEHKEKVYHWMKGVMLWLNQVPEDVTFVSTEHVYEPNFEIDQSTYFEMLVKDITRVTTGDFIKDSVLKVSTWFIQITTKKENILLNYLDKDTRDNVFNNLLLARTRQREIVNGKREYMPAYNCMD